MRSIVSALVAGAVALTTAVPALAHHTPANPGDEVNCGDFSSWAEAQDWFENHVEYGDPARLDVDSDFVACETLPGATGPFTDVGLGSPFLTQIGWLALSGITTGYPDGSFHPGESISREAFAAFMYRYAHGLGTTPTCTEQRFDDVPINSPFCGHIEWLADMEITTGYPDGGFHPSAQITREAVAAFFMRFRDLTEPTNATCDPGRFRDLPGNPFCDAITWLAGTGITLGYDDGTFRPGLHISREAMAAFFYRYALAFAPEPPPEPPTRTVVAQPAAPQFLDVCGTDNDSILVPDDTAALDYSQSGEVGGEVTVTVTLKDPDTHEFAPGVQTSWTFTYSSAPCEPSEPEPIVIAQPAAPVFVDACGTDDDRVTVPPDTDVLDYSTSGEVRGTVIVTVALKNPAAYEFASGVQTSWTHTYTDEACPPPPPTNPECGDTLTESVVLVADLHCEDLAVPALTLTSGVTLDLGGYSIHYTGPNTAEITYGLMGWGDGEARLDDVTVKNGQVAGFDTAMEFGSSDDVTVSDVDVVGDVAVRFSGDLVLRDSTIEGDLALEYNGGILIENNTVRGHISVLAYDVEILGNTVEAYYGRGNYGMSFAEAGRIRIENNTIQGGTIAGIDFAWDVRDSTINNNTISGSRTAIQLGGLVGGIGVYDNDISSVEHGIHLTPVDEGSDGSILAGGFWIRGNTITDVYRGDAIRMNQGEDPRYLEVIDVTGNDITTVYHGHAVYAPYGASTSGAANTVSGIQEADPPCVGDVECLPKEARL